MVPARAVARLKNQRLNLNVAGPAAHPEFDPLRGDPRFDELVSRLGL